MAEQVIFSKIYEDYRTAINRVIFLDLDGTLVPIEHARPLPLVSSELKRLLRDLSEDKKNNVVIISGRTPQDMSNIFPTLEITMVAEHGGFQRQPFSSEWKIQSKPDALSQQEIIDVIDTVVRKHSGSSLQKKAFSFVWNYFNIKDRIDHPLAASEFMGLRSFYDLKIYEELYSIEIRHSKINKGKFVSDWLNMHDHDFVMAIGDGQTDEDMFKTLAHPHYTIKVGKEPATMANYYLHSQVQVIPFLTELLK